MVLRNSVETSDAIPMGGSFSAQCADLPSAWALKIAVEKMEQFGKLIQTGTLLLPNMKVLPKYLIHGAIRVNFCANAKKN